MLTVTSFQRTRAAMLAEIELGIRRSAASVSADVDKVLYERLLNASTWNHLEVMQDLRLGDVDKRLSNFLSEMKQRYGGIYRDLHALSPQQRIVASSDAARIGSLYVPAQDWISTSLPGGRVYLERLSDADGAMILRISIPSQFSEGDIGQLVLEFNWGVIQAILDSASDNTRKLLMVDASHHPFSASSGVALSGASQWPVDQWLRAAQDGELAEHPGQPLLDAPALIGFQNSRGFDRWPGLNWTYLVMQSKVVALQPVHRMAWTFAGLLALIALATIAVSILVADSIAKPVVALTDFTRRYALASAAPSPPTPGPGEIGELTRSFLRLMNDLAHSQNTLAQASKLAAVGEITAMLAHDVRTPLGILRSSAQTLAAEPGLSAESRELLQIINSETGRLNHLISSLLDSARTRAPMFASADMNALIRHSAALLSTQARERQTLIELRLDGHPSVECDSEQIMQVLLNLGMNALQILPTGGCIMFACSDEAQRIVIDVEDNGPGVAVEDRARIFEPFVYRREGGIGLGLAVVRQIVRQHGGDITVDGSSLGGARFRFWLPKTRLVTT